MEKVPSWLGGIWDVLHLSLFSDETRVTSNLIGVIYE